MSSVMPSPIRNGPALDDITGGNGYWAPDISYHQGRFYITVTFRHNDIGPVYRHQIIVSSDKPEGPYSKPAVIDEDGMTPVSLWMMTAAATCF